MRANKRFTTGIATMLICALALTIGALPSIAIDGNGADAPVESDFEISQKISVSSDDSLPRFRTPAERTLIEISQGSLASPPSVVLASESAGEDSVQIEYPIAELDQFRMDVVVYIEQLEEVAAALSETEWARENPDLIGVGVADVRVSTEQLRETIQLVSYEELSRTKSVFDADPLWRERPAQMLYDISSVTEGQGGSVSPAWSTWAPPKDWDPEIFAARFAALNSAIAMEVIPPDITIIVFGAGTSFPNPLYIAAVLAWGISENVVIWREEQQDNRDDYNMEYLIDHAHRTGDRVRDNLDLAVSSVDARVATHDTTVAGRFNSVDLSLFSLENHLVAQDGLLDALELHLRAQDTSMAARFDFVDGELATVRAQLDAQDAYMDETRTLMMRMAIEENLLSDDPALASFLTPAADGGRLDEARTIVSETLANMRASGLGVNNADFEFSRGDAAYAAGEYKEAYERYRAAYREAVQ